MNNVVIAHGICRNLSKKFEAPPCVITVTITINDVVVNIVCRASDTVFRIANAKDIAPLNPKRHFYLQTLFSFGFVENDFASFLTSKK